MQRRVRSRRVEGVHGLYGRLPLSLSLALVIRVAQWRHQSGSRRGILENGTLHPADVNARIGREADRVNTKEGGMSKQRCSLSSNDSTVETG